jgi:hypothetical protein
MWLVVPAPPGTMDQLDRIHDRGWLNSSLAAAPPAVGSPQA